MFLTSCITFRSIDGANFACSTMSCLAKAGQQPRPLFRAGARRGATIAAVRHVFEILHGEQAMSKNKVVATFVINASAAAARPRHLGIVVASRPCVVASRQRAERERRLHSSSHRSTQLTLLQHVLRGINILVILAVARNALHIQEGEVMDGIAERVDLRLIIISKLAKVIIYTICGTSPASVRSTTRAM